MNANNVLRVIAFFFSTRVRHRSAALNLLNQLERLFYPVFTKQTDVSDLITKPAKRVRRRAEAAFCTFRQRCQREYAPMVRATGTRPDVALHSLLHLWKKLRITNAIELHPDECC